MKLTYDAALAAIAALEPRGWKLGLERMTEFVHRIGLDEAVSGTGTRFVHVAGTNGKGSTTAYVQAMLTAAGYRTGGFFSPYVLDPRERVQFKSELISRDDFAALTEELLLEAAKFDDSEFGGISEFEFKTALGFLFWHRQKAEWVALETGLGGRLDSTNVVTPAVSIIVSIGLDHQAILGDTIEQIAFEKAGIIKAGRPVVVGEMPDGARDVILNVAHDRRSEVWCYGSDIRMEGTTVHSPAGKVEGVDPGLIGVWQRHNVALAVAGLQLAGAEVTDEQVRFGARNPRIPGRFQRYENYVLDGAHNEDSARALAETLALYAPGKKLVLVTNMLTGHEPEVFYSHLVSHVGKVVVVPIEFHRARPTSETVNALRALGLEAEAVGSIPTGLELAQELARDSGTEILVTGSFYLVGEVGRYLGLAD